MKILSSLRDEHHQRYQQDKDRTKNLTGYLSVLDDGEIELQAVPAGSPCLGKTLAELDFRAATGTTVMGIIRHEHVIYSPSADLSLEEGDTLMLLLGDDQTLQRARNLLHGYNS